MFQLAGAGEDALAPDEVAASRTYQIGTRRESCDVTFSDTPDGSRSGAWFPDGRWKKILNASRSFELTSMRKPWNMKEGGMAVWL